MAIESNGLSAFGGSPQVLGLSNSVFNTTDMVDFEIQMLERNIEPDKNRLNVLSTEKKAWSSFKSDMSGLGASIDDVRFHNPNEKKVEYSKQGVVDATATANVDAGSYDINVTKLASAQQIAGKDMGASDVALGLSDTFSINGTNVAVTNDMTLRDLATAINGADSGASATIISNRLVMTSDKEGALNKIALADGANGSLKTLGVLNPDDTVANELRVASDAQFSINGIASSSDTNEVTDAIQGLTLNLTGQSSTTIKIDKNVEESLNKIEEFVKAYNDSVGSLMKHTAKGQVLQGQSVPLRMKMAMSSISGFVGPSGDRMFQVGLETDGDLKNGMLKLDMGKLKEQLEADPQKVENMFFGEAGMASYLKDKIGPYTGATGSISATIESLGKRITDTDKVIERKESSMDMQIESIVKKYSEFETMMSKLNNELQYMEAQLESFNSGSE